MTSKPGQSKNSEILRLIQQLTGRFDKLERQLIENRYDSLRDPHLEPSTKTKSAIRSKPDGKQKRNKLFTVLSYPFRTYLGKALGIFALCVTIVTGYVELRYDISVMPFSSLDPSDPGETRFLITNQGPFSISHVFYLCKLVPPRSNQISPLIAYGAWGLEALPSLRSHGSFSAYCKYPTQTPRPIKEGTLVDVEVTYAPKFLPWSTQTGGTLFILKFDKGGDAVWLPAGDMTPRAEDLEKLFCQSCSH